jgi:hypothetical protein
MGNTARTASGAASAPAPRDADAILADVRAVLARFDWEHDDRQLALEEIDQLVSDAAS